jgi:hypothetical protein
MTSSKPEQTKDPIWGQHLRWLDLVSNECKSNQIKRDRKKRREESPGKA